jgi:hypothetical protein
MPDDVRTAQTIFINIESWQDLKAKIHSFRCMICITGHTSVDFESDLNITGKLESTLLRNCEDQAVWKYRVDHLAHSVSNFAQLKVTTNLIDPLNFVFRGKKGIPHRARQLAESS